MAWVRVSQGLYRDTVTGKIVRSATTPKTPGAPATTPGATPKGTTPGSPNIGTALDKAFGELLANNNFGTAATGIEEERTLTNPNGTDQAIYDSVFAQLTKNTDKDKQKEYAAKSEELSLKGIPVGSALYNQQMDEFNRRYDDIIAGAKTQATTEARSAYQTAFTNQETLRQNKLAEQQAIRDANTKLLESIATIRDQYRKGILSEKEAEAAIKLKKEELAIARQRNAIMGKNSNNNTEPEDNGIATS